MIPKKFLKKAQYRNTINPLVPFGGGRAVVAWGKKRYTVGGLERGKRGFALPNVRPV